MEPPGSQAGHDVLRAFSRELEVHGVRAEINLVAPGDPVSAAYVDILKETPVQLSREDTSSGEVRQIHLALDSIGVAQPDPESIPGLYGDWSEGVGLRCPGHVVT